MTEPGPGAVARPTAAQLQALIAMGGQAEVQEALASWGLAGGSKLDWMAEARETLELSGEPELARRPGVIGALALLHEGDPAVRDLVQAALGRPIEGALETAATEIAVWRGQLSAARSVEIALSLGFRRKHVVEPAAAKARRLLAHALLENPGNADAVIAMLRLLRSQGEIEAAGRAASAFKAHVLRHLESYPGDHKARQRLASVHKLLGEDADELEQLQRIRAEAPARWDVHPRVAALLAKAGRLSEAAELLAALDQEGRLSFDEQLSLVTLWSKTDRKPAAVHKLHAMLDGALAPEDRAYVYEALAEVTDTDTALAVMLGRPSSELEAPAVGRLAVRYLMFRGRYDEAAEVHRKLNIAARDEKPFVERLRALTGRITKPVKPSFILVGGVGAEALGDLTMRLVWLASAKLHFRQAHLKLVTYELSEGGRAAVACCPHIDHHIIARPGALDETLEQAGLSANYVFDSLRITHLNLDRLAVRARFVIPEELRGSLDRQLEARGVGRDRWIVTVHCRHDSSFRGRHRKNYVRDVHPSTFWALADHIIDRLGGQVVWLGHPGMPAPPDRPHLVSLVDADVMLQNHAIARSRYFVGCDSGPVMTASAFGVPALKSNSIYDSGGWNPHDIILPKNVLSPDGRVISFQDVWTRDRLHWMADADEDPNFFVVDNTFEQLAHCVGLLQARTEGVDGWRPLQPAATVDAPPNAFPLMPRRLGPSGQIIELSHLLGRETVEAAEALREAEPATPAP